jgi:hypothetical protein
MNRAAHSAPGRWTMPLPPSTRSPASGDARIPGRARGVVVAGAAPLMSSPEPRRRRRRGRPWRRSRSLTGTGHPCCPPGLVGWWPPCLDHPALASSRCHDRSRAASGHGAPDAQRRFHVTYRDPTRRSEPVFGELALAESPAAVEANPCWRLHPGTDGHARARPEPTTPPSSGRLAAKPASMPGTVGAACGRPRASWRGAIWPRRRTSSTARRSRRRRP